MSFSDCDFAENPWVSHRRDLSISVPSVRLTPMFTWILHIKIIRNKCYLCSFVFVSATYSKEFDISQMLSSTDTDCIARYRLSASVTSPSFFLPSNVEFEYLQCSTFIPVCCGSFTLRESTRISSVDLVLDSSVVGKSWITTTCSPNYEFICYQNRNRLYIWTLRSGI